MTKRRLKDKTIGEIIKTARLQSKISIEAAHHELKIKVKLLEYIETNKFDKFDSHTLAKGFIKNYARFLGLNYERLVAMYRRDVENVDMKRVITPLVEEDDVVAEPKITEKVVAYIKSITITKKRLIVVASVFFLIAFALVISRLMLNTFDKPLLQIQSPFEISGNFKGRIEYSKKEIIITGKTESGTAIAINDVPVFLSPDYTFVSETIPLTKDQNVVIIKAENNLGSKSKIELLIVKNSQEIIEMNVEISSPDLNSNLSVKSDDVVLHNGWLLAGEKKSFTAIRNFFIETETPEYLNLLINGEEYVINTGKTSYTNNITEISVN